MAYQIRGTTVTEFSGKTGPEGRALKSDDATGLTSHREACAATRSRAKAGPSVGFEDTPQVTAAFDSLKEKNAAPPAKPAAGKKAGREKKGDT